MSEDFCLGSVVGLVAAGIVGFTLQQIYLAYNRMGEAGRPQRIVLETEETPSQVVQRSIMAGCGLLIFALVVLGVIWILLESL